MLVIDFDEHVGETVRSILEPLGALLTVTTAAAAGEVSLIADVIVCDLELIEAAGAEFLGALRRKHARLGQPAAALAFVTGGVPALERVRAAGFQGSVAKPIDRQEFRRAVLALTGR